MASRNFVAVIPVGIQGLWGVQNSTVIPHGGLLETESISFVSSIIKKEFGLRKIGNTVSGKIVGGLHYLPDGVTTRHILVTDETRLLKMDSAGSVTVLASGLNSTKSPVLVQGGKEGSALSRKVFFFTGSNQVKVLTGDGTTVTNISNPPSDWTSNFPKSGFIFENRLCGFGNSNDPHRLYFSTQTNHEDFVGTGSLNIAIFPGDGVRLAAAVPITNGVVLIKYPRGIYFLDASDPVSSNWKVYKVSDDLGTFDQNHVTIFNGTIFYIDVSGRLKTITTGQQRGLLRISDFIQETKTYFDNIIRKNVSFNDPERFRISGYPKLNELVLAFAMPNEAFSKFRINIDFEISEPRFRTSTRDRINSMWTDNLGDLYIGDDASNVYVFDQKVFDKNGSNYPSYFMTKEYTFSEIDPMLETRSKNLQFIELDVLSAPVSFPLTVDVFLDGELSKKYTVNVPQMRPPSKIGSSQIGGTNPARIGTATSKTMTRIKFRAEGSGTRIAYRVTNNTTQQFEITRIITHFTVGD